jgi:hypothetical protein
MVMVRQRCVGDNTKTTGWSELIVLASPEFYQQLDAASGGICRPSNLSVVRRKTAELMEQVVGMYAAPETPDEKPQQTKQPEGEPTKQPEGEPSEQLQVEAESVAPVTVQAEPTEMEAASPVETEQPLTATKEQLKALTIKQLRSLASKYNITDRAKTRKAAEQVLIPKLLGLVTIEDLN